MNLKPFSLLLAAMAGALMALQGVLNNSLGKVVGLPRAVLVVQLTGAAAVAALVLAVSGDGNSLARLGRAPWYTMLGGLIGVAIVMAVAASIGRVGVGPATTSIIIAQLITAFLIDHFGLFGLERASLDTLKMVGISLIAGGGWLLLRR